MEHQRGTSQHEQPSVTPEGLSLPKFVEKYSKQLPLRARFLQGYYGQNIQMEANDIYTFHFVKQKQVARVTDAGGSDYSIPLSSSLQFGMMFSPKSKRGEDVQRVEFEKVSDLMALHTLPKVVCATKAFKGVAEQSSVKEGEILIIPPSIAYGEMGLKVFSLLTKSEKILPGSCAGCFSIYPPLLRMHLPEFFSHFSGSLLPCQVQVFLDKEAPSRVSNILATFLSSPVTVQEVTTECSVIVSYESSQKKSKSGEAPHVLDIPVNETFSDVQLTAILPLDSAVQKSLTESTRKILSSFDPLLQQSLKETKVGHRHRIQSVLYSTLHGGNEGVGVKLVSSLGEVVFGNQFAYDYEKGEDERLPKKRSAIYEVLPGDEHYSSIHVNKAPPSTLSKSIGKAHIYQPLDPESMLLGGRHYDVSTQQPHNVRSSDSVPTLAADGTRAIEGSPSYSPNSSHPPPNLQKVQQTHAGAKPTIPSAYASLLPIHSEQPNQYELPHPDASLNTTTKAVEPVSLATALPKLQQSSQQPIAVGTPPHLSRPIVVGTPPHLPRPIAVGTPPHLSRPIAVGTTPPLPRPIAVGTTPPLPRPRPVTVGDSTTAKPPPPLPPPRGTSRQLKGTGNFPHDGQTKNEELQPHPQSSVSNTAAISTTLKAHSTSSKHPLPPAQKHSQKPKLVSRSQKYGDAKEKMQSQAPTEAKVLKGRKHPAKRRVDLPATPPQSPKRLPPSVTEKQQSASLPVSDSPQKATNSLSEQGSSTKQMQPAATPEGLSLPKFVEKYSKQLPLGAKFLQGYYGQNFQLEVDDIYTFHFVKQKQVARVTDAGGSDYSIPLSSSLQFGMMFSPKSKRGEDVQRVEFEKVSDLMALHTLPKVVCATKAFKGVAEQSSVKEGEILIIPPSIAYGEMGLKVFSLLTKSEKILPGSCAGCFSIYPPLLRMHLPEFFSHFSGSLLPCQVQVFLDKEAPSRVSNILATFLSSPVTVQEVTTECSVIVSSESSQKKLKSGEAPHVLDIPVNETFSDVQLTAILPLDSAAQKSLTESTRKILSSFDPLLQQSLKETKVGHRHRIQSVLYSTLHGGNEGVGVKLVSSLGEVVFGNQFAYDYEKGEDERLPKKRSAIYEVLPGDEHYSSIHVNKAPPSTLSKSIGKAHIYQPLDPESMLLGGRHYDVSTQQPHNVRSSDSVPTLAADGTRAIEGSPSYSPNSSHPPPNLQKVQQTHAGALPTIPSAYTSLLPIHSEQPNQYELPHPDASLNTTTKAVEPVSLATALPKLQQSSQQPIAVGTPPHLSRPIVVGTPPHLPRPIAVGTPPHLSRPIAVGTTPPLPRPIAVGTTPPLPRPRPVTVGDSTTAKPPPPLPPPRGTSRQLKGTGNFPHDGQTKNEELQPHPQSSVSNTAAISTTLKAHSTSSKHPLPPAQKHSQKPKLVSRSQKYGDAKEKMQSQAPTEAKVLKGRKHPAKRRVDLPATPPQSPKRLPPSVTEKQQSASLPVSDSPQKATNSLSEQGSSTKQMQPAATPEGLSLPKFVEKYSKQLPLGAKFLQGYYGQNLQLEVDDIYTFHFVKQKQVARVTDAGGSDYSIPLSSSLQFGMMFSPKSKRGEDVQRVEFEKVSDLMALHTLPKVVCATKAFKGVAEQSSVKEGEILIIPPSIAYGEMGLKVFSLLTKSEKILPGSCAGCFSIYPPLLRMHLPECFSHFSDSLPCQVQVFLDKEAPSRVSNILATFLSSPVTVHEITTECSVIVSSESSKKKLKSGEAPHVLDIPVNETFSDVQLTAILPLDSAAQKSLTESTRKILSSFDPLLQQSLKETKAGHKHRIQSVLYSTLHAGNEGVGVKLVSSLGEVILGKQFSDYEEVEFTGSNEENAIYECLPGDEQVAPNIMQPSPAIKDLHIYQPLDKKKRSTTEQKYDLPFHQSKKVAPGSGRAASDHHKHTHASRAQEGNIRLLSTAPDKNLPRSSPLQAHLVPLRDVNLPPLPQPHLVPLPTPNPISKGAAAMVTTSDIYETLPGDELLPPPQPDKPQGLFHSREPLFPEAKRELSVEEANRRFLHSMSIAQVQDLLEAMDLTRYSDAFVREHISGEILAELDEAILQQDLGVNSKLHQIRLMKVITGKHSAQNILEGMDPYGTGTHV